MCRGVLVIGLLTGLNGCATHLALRKDTARTADTLMDLQYQQVLDNVARFHANPDTAPSFAVASAGTVSIADTAGAGVSPTYSPTLTNAQQGGGALPILSLLFPLTASRAVTENWSLTPITDADNLRRLRCAYRLLVMGEATPNYEFCRKQMKEFFAGEEAEPGRLLPAAGLVLRRRQKRRAQVRLLRRPLRRLRRLRLCLGDARGNERASDIYDGGA